ncbi:MAG: hypothetical protein K6A35_03910 [bacterium]|nr:hypothetical protein [bacterium]
MRAQELDRSVRAAQEITRTALDRLVDEMRLACPVSTGSSGDVTPSGVLYPDSYKSSTSVSTHASSSNKVVFTRMKSQGDAGINGNYVFVTWYVPSTNDAIYRVVSNYDSTGSALTKTDITDRIAGNFYKYSINPSNFPPAAPAGTTRSESDIMVASFSPDRGVKGKNGPFSRFSAKTQFTVSHSKAPTRTNSTAISGDYADPVYYTYYDRNSFNVKFTTTVEKKGKGVDSGDDVVIELESQVRLQS